MKAFEAKIISDKMTKVAVAEIKFVKKHPFYKKRLLIKRKIHVQNEVGAKTGDQVKISQCRPVSKTVAFKIVEIIK